MFFIPLVMSRTFSLMEYISVLFDQYFVILKVLHRLSLTINNAVYRLIALYTSPVQIYVVYTQLSALKEKYCLWCYIDRNRQFTIQFQ